MERSFWFRFGLAEMRRGRRGLKLVCLESVIMQSLPGRIPIIGLGWISVCFGLVCSVIFYLFGSVIFIIARAFRP